MKFIVCIKQVPAGSGVNIDRATGNLRRESVPGVINPCDLNALEEALRLKEICGAEVTIISMGPPMAEESVREALAMGADDGALLSDRVFAGADTLATSYALARGIDKIGPYELIFCGVHTSDGETGHVGPQLAWLLDIPCVTYVEKVEELADSHLTVWRELDDLEQQVQIALPGLVTIVPGINQPRLPSLGGMMKAKKATVPIWGARDIEADDQRIGSAGSPTQVRRIFSPPKSGTSDLIEGTTTEQAIALVDRLETMGIV